MIRRLFLVLLTLLAWAPAAQAVEYRLQVASLHERSFAYFLNGVGRGQGELAMPRLERALDNGEIPPGAMLVDRPFRHPGADTAAAFRAIQARGDVKPAEGKRFWDEAVWDGVPGQRTLWVIGTSRAHYQQIEHLALKGKGALRYHVPYLMGPSPGPTAALSLPLHFLFFHQERGTLWNRYLGNAVGLTDGIAAVVGINDNPTFPDWVYILVEQPAEPTTFKVVIGWERRPSTGFSDQEGRSARD